MAEHDLSNLKDTPVPPPSAEAKRAALAAAMAAFDKKSESDAQGSAAPARLNDASSRTEGRKKMRQTFHFNRALAASIAALMIGAPAAFMLSRQYAPGGGTFSNISGHDSAPAIVAVAPRAEAPASLPAPAPVAPALEQKAKTTAAPAGALRGRVDGLAAAPPARVANSLRREGAEPRMSKQARELKNDRRRRG